MELNECLAVSGGTKAFVVGNNVYTRIPGLLKKEYGTDRVFLIADENTMRVTGNDVERALLAAGITIAGKHVFPGEPRLHAEYRHVTALVQAITKIPAFAAQQPVPVAIGSGTINDLAKRAASEISLPYFCIPTAASVDGFTSFGAAILKDGFKQTLSCDAPRCIVVGTEVMARAPAWLSSSGFADLAGKIIAGADWIIADAAAPFDAKGADRIEAVAWEMVQQGLRDYLARSVSAARGNPEALKALFEALSITGFAMQYSKDSRPVSGAEHLFAHVWEMDDLCVNGNPVTHGHKVAIGTLAGTAFLETLFADPDGPPPPPSGFRRPSLEERVAEAKTAFAGSPALEGVVKTIVEKFPGEAIIAKTTEGFRGTWKKIRAQVLEQIMPYAELRAMFVKAQCPVLPAEVNLTRSGIIACARRAQMIRKRYNGLDLAWDFGCFETVLAAIEKSDVYFY